jgi:hypothetical protein
MFEKFPVIGNVLLLAAIIAVPLAFVVVAGGGDKLRPQEVKKYPDEHLYI